MARNTSPEKLVIVCVAILGLVPCLSSCIQPATSVELASHAVASNAIEIADRLAGVASEMDAPSALDAAQMSQVTENVAIDDAGGQVAFEAPGLEVGYRSYLQAQTLVVDALIRGNGQTHQGLGGTATQLYGCAEFRADFGMRQIAVRDIECPSWLSEWTQSADLTSVTEVSGKALQDVTW
jgi:hypothetical protein